MRIRSILVAVVVLLGACTTTSLSGTPVALTDRQKSIIRSSIVAQLKDPDSARFGPMAAIATPDGQMIACGFVNARNSFGGYTGMQPFVGHFGPGNFIISANGSTPPMYDYVLDQCRRAGVLI
jgi:hypothetical protein